LGRDARRMSVRQSGDDAFQMFREGLRARGSRLGARGRGLGARSRLEPDRASPLVEDVEDVGLAEIDFDRPPPRSFPVVPLEVAIDASEGDLQRHTLLRPRRDAIERRPGDANQMTVVLSTEIGLYLPAEVSSLQSEINPKSSI